MVVGFFRKFRSFIPLVIENTKRDVKEKIIVMKKTIRKLFPKDNVLLNINHTVTIENASIIIAPILNVKRRLIRRTRSMARIGRRTLIFFQYIERKYKQKGIANIRRAERWLWPKYAHRKLKLSRLT